MTGVAAADLDQITRTIWGTLFDLRLQTSDPAMHMPETGGATVTSVVHIDGAWHGAVLLQCSMALATELTTAMFQAGSEPSPDDIGDALGELTNMVAGNVKALLPEPCGISLPTVALGPDYQLSVVGAAPIATAAFTCGGHPLIVALLHRSSDGGGA